MANKCTSLVCSLTFSPVLDKQGNRSIYSFAREDEALEDEFAWYRQIVGETHSLPLQFIPWPMLTGVYSNMHSLIQKLKSIWRLENMSLPQAVESLIFSQNVCNFAAEVCTVIKRSFLSCRSHYGRLLTSSLIVTDQVWQNLQHKFEAQQSDVGAPLVFRLPNGEKLTHNFDMSCSTKVHCI